MRLQPRFLSRVFTVAVASAGFGAALNFGPWFVPAAFAQTTPQYHYECGSGNTAGLCLRVNGSGSQDATCGGGCSAGGGSNNTPPAGGNISSPGGSCANYFSPSQSDSYFRQNVTGNGPGGYVTQYNSVYYATPDAAQNLAACLGGTVVPNVSQTAPASPFYIPPTTEIQLPNGTRENAGYLIDRLVRGSNGNVTNWMTNYVGPLTSSASPGGRSAPPTAGTGTVLQRISAYSSVVSTLQRRLTTLESAGGGGAPAGNAAARTSGVPAPLTIEVSPLTRNVGSAGSITYNITVHSNFGTDSPVTLSASGLPQGMSGFFTPPQVSSNNGTSVLTVNVTGAVLVDLYTFRVTGTLGDGSAKSTSVSIAVGATKNLDAVGPLASPGGAAVYGYGYTAPGGTVAPGTGGGILPGGGGAASSTPPGPSLDAATFGGVATTTFRYLAVKSSRDGWIGWREIEAYDAGGNKVVPVQVYVSCDWCHTSSPKPSGESPAAVFDGDPSTSWGAGQTCTNLATRFDGYQYCAGIAGGNTWAAWIILDYGSSHTFSRVRLLPVGNSARELDQVYESQDGKSFSKITNFLGPVTDNQWLTYAFPASQGTPSLALTVNGAASTTVTWPAPIAFQWNASNVDYVDATFSLTDTLTPVGSPAACNASKYYLATALAPLPIPDLASAASFAGGAPLQYASSVAPFSNSTNACDPLAMTVALHGVQATTGATVDQTAVVTILPSPPLTWDLAYPAGSHLSVAVAVPAGASSTSASVPINEYATFDVKPTITAGVVPAGLSVSFAPSTLQSYPGVTPSFAQIGTLTVVNTGAAPGMYSVLLQGVAGAPWTDRTPRTLWVDIGVSATPPSSSSASSATFGPAVSLTANGQHDITVGAGDPIAYVWSTSGAVSAASTYEMMSGQKDACSLNVNRLSNVPYPWVAATLQGSDTENVQACQQGITYRIVYSARDANGATGADQVTVRVRGTSQGNGSSASSSPSGSASSPAILSLGPSSGPVGTQVTITGSGFTPAGNTVSFDIYSFTNLASSNGTTLTFTVPSQLYYNNCTGAACSPGSARSTLPGTYNVFVSNANGTSNNAPFTVVTASSSGNGPSAGNPDFSLTALPSSAPTLLVGSSFTYTVSIMPLSGFEGTVAVSIPNPPQGITGGFLTGDSNNPLTYSKSVTVSAGQPQSLSFQFAASAYTSAGTYSVLISASSNIGGVTISHSLTLTIGVAAGIGSAPPARTASANNIGVYIWGGSYVNAGAGHLLSQAVQLAAQSGFQVVRVTLSPTYNIDYNISSSCFPNFTLQNLASSPEYQTAFSTPGITTFMLTAYDGTTFGDCTTKKYLSLSSYSSNTATAIQNEYRDLTLYLSRTYKNSGKSFIISNWEGDNDAYCGAAYSYATDAATRSACDAKYAATYGGNSGPQDTTKALSQWFAARQAGISQGRTLAAAEGDTGVSVSHAPEFNIVHALKDHGFPGVLYSVLPTLTPDFVSYSSYESINQTPSTLPADIQLIRQVTGGIPLIIGEFGFDRNVYGDSAATTNLQSTVATIKSSNVSYGVVWQMFDQGSSSFGLYDSNAAARPERRVF